jgi:hypothetical protein
LNAASRAIRPERSSASQSIDFAAKALVLVGERLPSGFRSNGALAENEGRTEDGQMSPR